MELLREQGVWGEATHTREMCACARLLKSGCDHILHPKGFKAVL